MINLGDLKKGKSIEIDGRLLQVLLVQHVKTKKSAVYKVKVKDLRSGSITEKSFNAGEKLQEAQVERRTLQYLYREGQQHIFMNNDSYEQVSMNQDTIKDEMQFIIEGAAIQGIMAGDEVLGIELPPAVELTVTESDPGIKGDTSSGATKPAQLETGLSINVPLFINVGDKLKISTDTGEYLERLS
ncbi:MAG: elongation factor P [Dehalococcoidia bacterium]|jgi:elongation factor P|nr:elongation factor P [Dehalococcoidia bacterium]